MKRDFSFTKRLHKLQSNSQIFWLDKLSPRTRTSTFLHLLSVLIFIGLVEDLSAGGFWVRTFRPWQGYAISSGEWLVSDLNGDGKKDLVHLVQDADYVHTWISQGDGTFSIGTFRPWEGYGISNGKWLAVDLNGDGKTDLVHLVQDTDYAHTWMSRGDGTFSIGTFRPWEGYGISNGKWLTGDLNGDGKSDLVHLVQDVDYVHTWMSQGDGTFSIGTFRPWEGYGISNGEWLAVDLNGDGKTDLVHLVQDTDYAHTWTSRGDGTFSIGTFRPWEGYGISSGQWQIGDLNGDSKTDLIHLVQDADYVHTWMSRGDGTFTIGTFRPWEGYGISNGLWLAGDFDNDGKADLVHAVQSTDYVHIWRSRGDGAFDITTFSPWKGYAIPYGRWLSGDITGDGRIDIIHAVNATDYVHPWISTLPMSGQISQDGLEITQAIQDMQHSVPLIPNKRTVVRAYLSYKADSPITVQGTLSVRNLSTGTSTTINSMSAITINPVQNDQIRPKRENVNAGLVFELPNTLTSPSVYSFNLSNITNTTTGTSVACSDCPTSPVSISIRRSYFAWPPWLWSRGWAPLRVRLIGLSYQTGTPPTTFTPSAQHFNLIESWLRRAYPIGQLTSSTVNVTANNTWPFTCNDANAQVAAIRVQDINGGTDARTHYYGLVADGGGFMRGCSASIPDNADPAVVASGPTGTSDFGWDFDGAYGDWYTGHELGHTFGRKHIGSSCGESSDDSKYPFPKGQLSDSTGAFVGFDVGDSFLSISKAALPGVTWHDVMSYCDYQWLSSYTYLGIMSRLNNENLMSAGAPAPVIASAIEVPASSTQALTTAEFESAPPKIKDPKPAYRKPVKQVLGYKKPPTIKQGERAVVLISKPSMERPDIPKPEFWGEIDIPTPARISPPAIRQAWNTASDEAALTLLGREITQQEANVDTQEKPRIEVKTGDYLSIVCTVNLTQSTGKIQYVSRVSKALLPETEHGGQARIRLLDSGGKLLGEYAVKVKLSTDIPAGQDKTGLVDAIVPYLPSTALTQLVLLGNVIDSLRASKNTPTVQNVKLPAVQTIAALQTQPLVINWEANDADGDKLTYNVQMSSDNGKTWQIIAFGISITSFTLDPNQIKGLDSVMIRVIASDGFNSSIVTSDTLQIPKR